MKTHFIALFALCLGGTQGLGQDQMKLDVLPVTEIRSIDDLFLLQVCVTNLGKEAVLVPIPVNGLALGLEVAIAEPEGWVKKMKPAVAQGSGITVVTSTGPIDVLRVIPGTTQQFTLDLRDYFDVIDLQKRDFKIEVKINPIGPSAVVGQTYQASWSGKLSLSAKNPKGTTIRF